MDRLAVGLWGGMPLVELIDVVKVADGDGYEAAFVIESYADQYAVLAACASATEQIDLGTGVTTVFSRTPTAIAVAGATVDALSRGRFVLGLGVGHREIVRMRDDLEPARPLPFTAPLQRLRETVDIVRLVVEAAVRNEPVSYRGQIFELRDYRPWIAAYRSRFPISFGSFSERGWELAGEIADGVLPIFMPLSMIGRYTAAVHRGAERAGRDPAEIDIGCYLPCCVSDDEEEARLAMRYLLSFHMAEYVHYRRWFEEQGQGELVARIGGLIGRGDTRAAAALITDEMVDGIAIAGTPEQCRAGIARYRAAGIALPVVYPIYPGFTGYLPNPATRAGILHTIEALAPR